MGTQALGQIVVRQVGDHPVRVADVVTKIVDGEADPDSAAVRDGTSAVVLSIRRTKDGTPFDVTVPVARLSPAETFVSAIADSADLDQAAVTLDVPAGEWRVWALTRQSTTPRDCRRDAPAGTAGSPPARRSGR